ncbi:hypothetical protein [Modestobacter sp. Leaf380]|uniref:hypothetical protein n=1 Tax=Modestobacter sp. Leaf380 TaxID=1736356 RepID=UPI0006F38484|nr:hypothetical protein [Modestobacter sp. Leaf380]KQS69343.1 hypothetical protein ASG41_21340 [Modestobacter sp. Leaf380]
MPTAVRRRLSHLVRRLDADRYLQLLLLGFGGSIVVTRLYLEATDYPTVGGDTLHIAHAVWGGLLLFVGGLLPLVLANRSAMPWAGLLTGIGAGLFVDEIGKFITTDNDYFFAAAAPVAYAVFVLAMWLYFRVRGQRDDSPRSQLHAALELLGDVVDGDLSRGDRRELERRLESACSSGVERHARLAGDLLELTRSGALDDAVAEPGRLRRLLDRADGWLDRHLHATRLRRMTTGALAVLGVVAVSDLAVVGFIGVDLLDGTTSDLADAANDYAAVGIQDALGTTLLLSRVALDLVVGVLLLTAAVALLRGRDRRGIEIGQAGLLLALTVVNVLLFYTQQWVASGAAVLELAALGLVWRFRREALGETPDGADHRPDDR